MLRDEIKAAVALGLFVAILLILAVLLSQGHI